MGDPTQDIIDQSHPPLPIPCPVPTTFHTARSRGKSSPPGPTPTNGPTVIKTIIYFVLSANATSAVPTPGGLEQRTNSSEQLQVTQSLPTKLHWQKLNFCLITDSWCIDTHSGFLLSCLAVLVVAFLFELALWTSRWYDRGLIARLHHLKTQMARSQSPPSRPSTSESEETIRPNHGFGGRTTEDPHNAANTTTPNGTNSQDHVPPANGHASSSSTWSAQPRSPPTTPNLSTPGNAAFKALSAGRQRVEGTGIILGSPDRSMPLENSPRSASVTSQSTAGPSRRRRSTLAPIENRPTLPEPPATKHRESAGSSRKKNKKARSGGVPAPRNSPEKAPLLDRTITGRAYTSLHDVAAAADLPISENILNDDSSPQRSTGPQHDNETNETNDRPSKLRGIDEVGDPYTLFCGLGSLFTTLSNTLTNSTKIVPAWGALCRAILSALQVSLALALGLVVTTFNGYYLGCIVLGVFVGKLVLGMVDVACWVDVGVGFVVRDGDGEGDARGRGEVARQSIGGANGNGGNGVGNGRVRMSDYERGILVPLLGTTTGL